MQTTRELGALVAERRRSLGMQQKEVAKQAGLTHESLSRFERGHLPEFGVRRLINLFNVLGLELRVAERGTAGNLDELRQEHSGT